MNLVKARIPSGYCVRMFLHLLEICLATIGVCVFQCANFGWRTFYITRKNGGHVMKEKNEMAEMVKEKKKKIPLLHLALLIGALLLILTLFTPFTSSKGSYREYLQQFPDKLNSSEINMKNSEAIDISLFQFGIIFSKFVQHDFMKDISLSVLIVIVVFALLLSFAALASIRKKPKLTIIFTILSYGVFRIIVGSTNNNGVFTNSNYGLGIAPYLYYLGAALVIAGSVALIVQKINSKKENISTETRKI